MGEAADRCRLPGHYPARICEGVFRGEQIGGQAMKAIDYYGKYHYSLLNPETGLAEYLEVR